MSTENPHKHLILAADPDDGEWSILLETENKDQAAHFWDNMETDPSLRIAIYTGDFITFPVTPEESDDEQ